MVYFNGCEIKVINFFFLKKIKFFLLVIFLTKRYGPPIGRHCLRNRMSFVGIAVSIVSCVLISYLPSSENTIRSGVVNIGILVPPGGGLLLIIYESIRKYLIRKGYLGGIPNQIPKNEALTNLKSFDAGHHGGSHAVLSKYISRNNLAHVSNEARIMSTLIRNKSRSSYNISDIYKKDKASGEEIKPEDFPVELREIVDELFPKKV